MSDEKIGMPGDPDGDVAKAVEDRKVTRRTRAEKVDKPDDKPEEKDTSGADPTPGVQADTTTGQDSDKDQAAGNLIPAQYEDDTDGWGDTPVQMRGE